MNDDDVPLYQVIDWNDTFENAKSRECKQPSHVYKPNKMGIGLMNILVEEDGRTIYGTWCLILDLVSRQKKPRGGYLTANGKADGRRYRVAELAYLFRAPEHEIRRCLKVVTSPEVAWMSVTDGSPETGNVSGQQGIREVSVPGEQGAREVSVSGEQSIRDRNNHGNSNQLRQTDTLGPEAGYLSIPITEGREQKEPPSVPQGGTGTNGHRELSIPDLQSWISKLFGRERAWSYEETHLLSDIAPVSKKDRALLSWAYSLPRDDEGWALVSGKRASKPKQNIIGLLREFASEIDKWRSVRANSGEDDEPRQITLPSWTDERERVFHELFPGVQIFDPFHLIAEDLQRKIDLAVSEQKEAA